MLYLDLDQFKVINDTCGHSAGDEMLRQVTAILHTQLRTRDTLARLGGDEFGVLLEHCPLEEAMRVANDLRRAVQDFRFVRQGKYFTLGLSIGLVSVTESDGSLEAVLGAADQACNAAKDGGRNRVHVFQLEDPAMAQRHGDMQWVPRIQSALAEGRFRLYSQPIVALASDLPCGEWGEILLRLIDEQGKIILPEAFMPAAERYDQMYAIDRWVIGETIKVLRAKPLEAPPTRYAINVSGQSVGNEDLLEFVTEQLDGIAPGRLCFEITESAAISNLRVAGKLISTLKEKGCCFALDDGCGLSSFAYLKTLDVDYLKIDGGFVRNMTENPVDRAIVEATHQVSRALDLKTIAESVENETTLQALKAMGIDYA